VNGNIVTSGRAEQSTGKIVSRSSDPICSSAPPVDLGLCGDHVNQIDRIDACTDGRTVALLRFPDVKLEVFVPKA